MRHKRRSGAGRTIKQLSQEARCLEMSMDLAMREMKEKRSGPHNSMEDWQDSVAFSHDTEVMDE